MRKSIKAALLSGLVFPGLGQFFLKHYKSGAVILLTFLFNLSIVVMEAVKYALAILDKIQAQGAMIDVGTISDIAARASVDVGTFRFNFALLLAFLCWVLAIVDAYIVGKQMDRIERTPLTPSNSHG